MSLGAKLKSLLQPARETHPDIGSFAFTGAPPEGPKSDLERLFWQNEGPVVHKWLHYLPIYERYFAQFRGRPIRFLEIGVFKGGSLRMWRDYLGPEAVICGIDIDPGCAAFDGQAGMVRIGSQDDPDFLRSVVDDMGGVDVVLDDGSHDSRHIRASLDALYPRLAEGGVYMIEDLHCAYWPEWSGGYDAPESFMNDVKRMVDDIHHWYHEHGEAVRATAGHLAGLHVHDSIVVLEKRSSDRPAHHMVGG